ncbi:hypothetical protein HTIA_0087 [Halorhabdus tiamatea SARL4B]|uniref:Uncharacterized protein n=1 Tax=Halorhabdus tiamatea SARL4B TaxID=1033806 RepID=S6CYI7_9EURY|nr:hypothetical protein HTIA_0087 [Halorhabdus tiamatea SARL4B]
MLLSARSKPDEDYHDCHTAQRNRVACGVTDDTAADRGVVGVLHCQRCGR